MSQEINLPHFEDLWNDAEKLSADLNNSSRNDIFPKIKELLDDYVKIDNVPATEIQKVLRQKKIGEILFKLTELSRLDDINTYAALKLELAVLSKN